eukprot:gene37168-45112_t
MSNVPDIVQQAVLTKSTFDSSDRVVIKGIDFDQKPDLDAVMAAMLTTGFQATNVGLAIEEINRMLRWRLSDVPMKDTDREEWRDPEVRKNKRCFIFLSYTSNMISSG